MDIYKHGVEIHRAFLESAIVEKINDQISLLPSDTPLHGIRHANHKIPAIESLVHSKSFVEKAIQVLGDYPKAVRVIVFDKTVEKNWTVAWHQDRSICVNKKVTVEGWGPWSMKEGVHHVQPDVNVLNQILTFRVHLDRADKENGCLKVIPKTHLLGLLTQPQIDQISKEREPTFCEVQTGDLVLMKPLILHASNKSKRPNHRRVIHIEYSNHELPYGLMWC